MNKKLIALLFSAVGIFSCSENEQKAPKDLSSGDPLAIARENGRVVINGVERTELALTMRMMHDEMIKVKDSLEQGYEVRLNYSEDFKRIKEATPTEPKKIDAAYQGMADAFMRTYIAFEKTEHNQKEAFNIMLDNCLACHQHKCPGPVKAIKKLKITR